MSNDSNAVRVVRGKRRRRRSERAQFRDTLRSCAHQFIGGFESKAGRMFVEAMTHEARKNGRPLGGGGMSPERAARILEQLRCIQRVKRRMM